MSANDKVLMPRRLTAENGAKGALSGEFSEDLESECPNCGGDEEEICPECDGTGRVTQHVPITWDAIKRIYARAVELLGEQST